MSKPNSFSLRNSVLNSWRHPNYLSYALRPLSEVYKLMFNLRGWCYRTGLLASYRAPLPVIVVGNITIGGSGKTPLLISLVGELRELGFKPGVISRGYGGHAKHYPLAVTASTDPIECGDEPALIVKRTQVPMVVGPNRQADIQLLIAEHDIDIIISDDGLQHLALQRDIEICVLDHTSTEDRETNYYLLPAGPYRESIERLVSVDLIVEHLSQDQAQSSEGSATRCSMFLEPAQPVSISNKATPQNSKSLEFNPNAGIHAVVGIGKPQRFFDTCLNQGWNIEQHAFADHHPYVQADLKFPDDKPVLMTEKDAVKCQKFNLENHWYLPVDAKLSHALLLKFKELLADLKR